MSGEPPDETFSLRITVRPDPNGWGWIAEVVGIPGLQCKSPLQRIATSEVLKAFADYRLWRSPVEWSKAKERLERGVVESGSPAGDPATHYLV